MLFWIRANSTGDMELDAMIAASVIVIPFALAFNASTDIDMPHIAVGNGYDDDGKPFHILCFLGLHDWEYYQLGDRAGHPAFSSWNMMRCKRCGFEQTDLWRD